VNVYDDSNDNSIGYLFWSYCEKAYVNGISICSLIAVAINKNQQNNYLMSIFAFEFIFLYFYENL